MLSNGALGKEDEFSGTPLGGYEPDCGAKYSKKKGRVNEGERKRGLCDALCLLACCLVNEIPASRTLGSEKLLEAVV